MGKSEWEKLVNSATKDDKKSTEKKTTEEK
jgi:hypothetical protein